MGAECFLVKKSLCPLRFWVKYSQWMKSCRGWTILTKKSWGSGRFHRENVKGVDIFKEKTCQGCTFSYFLFFFSLRTPHPSFYVLEPLILLFFMQYEHAFKWLYIEHTTICSPTKFSLHPPLVSHLKFVTIHFHTNVSIMSSWNYGGSQERFH